MRYFTITEVSHISGVDEARVTLFVERHWVVPAQSELRGEGAIPQFDDEDLARIRLIEELLTDFGANDEAIPLILHLVDQLCYLTGSLRRTGSARPAA